MTLAQPLLDGLLDDARRSLSLEQQIELLAEAALLIDGRGQPQLLEQLGTRYRQLGQTAFDHDSSRPFSFVRHAILTAPLAFAEPWPVGDPELIRTELLQLAYTARWQETLNFCGMLRLFQLDGDVPLFDWAAALAAREGATSFAGMIHRQRESWRELLVAETGRQAYTRAAELTALLESGDLAGSARWIAALGVDDTGGLIPDAHDPLCASSLPVFVQNVIRDHPRLQQRIVAAESGTAELRVQQAIDEQDIDSLRLAALQFAGTEAAVTAQRWLGDRALAAGRFARALVHYGRAARQDSRVVDPSLAAKTVFANSAKRVDQPRFTPPADYQVAAHYELPGPTGRPAAEDDPAVFSFKIDTVSRHMSITVDGNTLFVNNRFHVAAFDANTGSTMWRSTPLPRRVGRNSEWLLTPMRPLIMADRLVVRQLYGAGPSLVCLDRFSGELSWIARQRPGVLIVSDPFLVEQRLVCLTLMRDRPDHWRLRLSQFDADTGALWREQDLVELRDHWQALRVCQVHAGAMSVLVTLGGVTLCCEPWGDLRWSRRHLIVPPDTDPGWITQEFARPVVRGDVAFLCQPGVRTAECVNVETGRLLWRRMLPGLRAVVGASDKQVIIHTDRGLVAVDALTGESKWSRTIQRILYAHRWDGSRYVMCAAQHDLTTGDTPRLVWVSVEDGRILKSLALPSLQGSEPCLGPLAAAGDRLWAIGGHGYDNPRRELVELVRVIE